MSKIITIGIWTGANFREIVTALYEIGYRTTKIYVYKKRLFIENEEFSEVIIIDDPVEIPISNESSKDREEEDG